MRASAPSTALALDAADPGSGALEQRVTGPLVVRALRGEAAAREELARRLSRPAYLFALQLLGHPDDARDVSQDALLQFFDHLDRFEPGRPVKPWLFRIVRNRVVDLVRRRRARPALSLDALLEDGAPVDEEDGATSPEERAGDGELRRRLWRALASLDPPHREILVLREYQDLAYREIAQVLGIPDGTVMSRLHAARKALRRVVLEDGLGDPRSATPADRSATATATATASPTASRKEAKP